MRNRNLRYFIVIQIMMDIAIIYMSLVFTFWLRFESNLFAYVEDYLPYEAYLRPVLFLIPIYLMLYYVTSQYKVNRRLSYLNDTMDVLKAHLVGTLIFLAILFTGKNIDYSRVFIVLYVVVVFVLTIVFRYLFITFKIQQSTRLRNRNRILIIGYSHVAMEFIKKTNENPTTGYDIIGILDNQTKKGYTYGGTKVIGSYDDLETHLTNDSINEVIVALRMTEFDQLDAMVNLCETYGVHTKFIPDYYQYIPSKPYVEDFDGIPIISIRKIPLNDFLNRSLKRLLDITASILGLIVLSPFLLIITLLVKITSKGPVFFKQTRVGLNKREFTILKFRSMTVQDSAKEKSAWTTKNDVRVTPLGKFMRRTNIDELPQLFNVLIGHMSLIGPRPERPYFVDQFMHTIPKYMIKHQVRPGMSGWAQVHGWRGDTSIEERIKHDIYYIENWSLLMDLKIIIMTLFKSSGRKNAY